MPPLDLAKLSREEKLELLAALEEKSRRDKTKALHFKPNLGQLALVNCQARERYAFCGNGFGKSAWLTLEAKWAAEGYHPYWKRHTKVPARIYVVLDHPDKVEEVWTTELKKWCDYSKLTEHKNGKPYVNEIRWPNGSFIQFLFWDQADMRFESLEGDVFIFDEPPPRKIYVGLKRAGRTKGSAPLYIFGGTPLAAPWLRREVWEPWSRGERKGTECFKFDNEVNRENLREGWLEEFAAVLSDKEKTIRMDGSFFDLEGLALAHLFKREVHVVPASVTEQAKAEGWPCVVAIDPHPQKKTHAVLLGVDRKGYLYVLKELALKATPREFARELLEWSTGFRIRDWVCDNFGSGEFTGGEGFKSFIGVLQEERVRVRPTRYDEKKDDAFIERIQDTLLIPIEGVPAIPRLRFVEECRGSITDVLNVEWVRHKDVDEYKPKLNITNRDFLSCVKYALATNPAEGLSLRRAKIIGAAAPANFLQRGRHTNKAKVRY